MSIEGRSVTIQWSTNSKQLLLEAVLHFRINWSEHWLIETIPAPQHQGSGRWQLQHKFELPSGIWYVRVKTRNTAGWSKYSKVETFEIENSLEEKPFGNQKRFISDQFQVANIGGGSGSATKTTSFVALGYSITSLLVISTLAPWFGLC
ncbi:uncharacterized protein LOC119655275 [Hermetia illucens]|nr:uncharacterized protein LOC119655275 [Hermetia illucens]